MYDCACMYVCMHVCMYACMYVRTCVRMYICMYVCMYVCMHVCMHDYVPMHACMQVGVYHTFVYLCMYTIHDVRVFVRRAFVARSGSTQRILSSSLLVQASTAAAENPSFYHSTVPAKTLKLSRLFP